MHEEISIYSPWTDPRLFKKIIDELSRPFLKMHVDKVLSIESRGFILGGAAAYKINAGFVLCRKRNKMYAYHYYKNAVFSEECIDYSGKKKGLEIETGGKGIKEGDRVVLIDDWWGKGAQGKAAIRLIERAGGKVVGVGIMLNEMEQDAEQDFDSYNLHSLIKRAAKKY
jgi:adenine phosphoribosyltransferase